MQVLAFDQALANTGWVFVDIGQVQQMGLLSWGTIRTTPRDKGHQGNIERGVEVQRAVARQIDAWLPELVLYEQPPVARRGMARPESSLLAALAVNVACNLANVEVLGISGQQAKRTLTGFTNADKGHIRLAIKERWPSLKVTNEHERDAWALAWHYASQERS
jgi:Holliday junction resolvasome RuvABC endonuclease subunit